MLEKIVQQLEQHLQQEGLVADILLKSEQSAYDAGDQHEIELKFTRDEQSDHPMAFIHVFPVDEVTCEIEVDVHYRVAEDRNRDLTDLWEQTTQIVEGATITEKKRFAGPAILIETEWIVNYFFLISLEESEEAEVQQVVARFSQEIGKLVRL